MYLALDAGGSKCLAAVFDEELHLVGAGIAGGVNTNTTTQEDSRRNAAQCLEQLRPFVPGERIERAYIVFVGPRDVLEQEMDARYSVNERVYLSEGQAGLLSGGGYEAGIAALAGTGSDAFYVRDHRRVGTVGGWGPILGDQGSGAWIGQQAIRAAVKAREGWGPATELLPMILAHWKLDHPWGMVPRVHGAPAPFREVASLTPLAGRAARAGDRVAREIFERAGELMAEQVYALIARERVPADEQLVVACGGAWKAYQGMFDRFGEALGARAPEARAERARFEPVVAGVADLLRARGASPAQVMAHLAAHAGQFQIDWGEDAHGRD